MTSQNNLTLGERLVYVSDLFTRACDVVVSSVSSFKKRCAVLWHEQTTRSIRAERFAFRFLSEVQNSRYAWRKIGRLKFLLHYYPKTLMRLKAGELAPIVGTTIVDCIERKKMRQVQEYADLFLHRGVYSSDAQVRHLGRYVSAALVRDVKNKDDVVFALLLLMTLGYKINLKILHRALIQQEFASGRGSLFSPGDAVYEHPSRQKYRSELVVVVEKMMQERRERAHASGHTLSDGQRRVM